MEPGRAWLRGGMWLFHLSLPVFGLWLLGARPGTDTRWEHHPAHFWLVVAVAAVNVGLAVVVSRAARQRSDARLYLVGLAFLAGAGFLGLHALATPGQLLAKSNVGFQLASPVGLVVAGLLAVASSIEFTPQRSAANLPISTAPDSLPPPKDHKQALGPSPACPQCESPMAWVEEHLRFYCKSCRMYF